jgi:hypothetical protein
MRTPLTCVRCELLSRLSLYLDVVSCDEYTSCDFSLLTCVLSETESDCLCVERRQGLFVRYLLHSAAGRTVYRLQFSDLSSSRRGVPPPTRGNMLFTDYTAHASRTGHRHAPRHTGHSHTQPYGHRRRPKRHAGMHISRAPHSTTTTETSTTGAGSSYAYGRTRERGIITLSHRHRRGYVVFWCTHLRTLKVAVPGVGVDFVRRRVPEAVQVVKCV